MFGKKIRSQQKFTEIWLGMYFICLIKLIMIDDHN